MRRSDAIAPSGARFREGVGFGDIGLDIQHRRPVKQIGIAEFEAFGGDREQCHRAQPDRVGPMGRTRRQHTVTFAVGGNRRPDFGFPGTFRIAVENEDQPDAVESFEIGRRRRHPRRIRPLQKRAAPGKDRLTRRFKTISVRASDPPDRSELEAFRQNYSPAFLPSITRPSSS
ncbi:hypothetical protein SDC9_146693 [bioreactor metagenome]|uniref:Uncharacterized protein n=1 Tax=bioreactor metagenome TaxID=1076179 RepID=A0A645EDZ5_9ZZZZ